MDTKIELREIKLELKKLNLIYKKKLEFNNRNCNELEWELELIEWN